MIDHTLIEQFERDGFVVLPQVLEPKHLERIVAAGDHWVASDHQTNRQQLNGGETDGFRNCITLDDAFLELLAQPKVLPYLVRLLGPDIKLLTSHQIYRQRAKAGTPISARSPGWHRDFAKAQRSLGDACIQRLDIKAAYCLSDLPEPGYGGTLFVPGSHKLREPIAILDGGDPKGAVEPSLKAGDCVLFENRTWHAGGANVYGDVRKAVMMGYTYVWIQPSDYSRQSPDLLGRAASKFGDVGLQLLEGLPTPEHFDFDYDSKPIRDWATANGLVATAPTG